MVGATSVQSDRAADVTASGFPRLACVGQGGMREMLQMLGTTDMAQSPGLDIPVSIRRLHEGDSLFHEGALAESIYFVRAGTFKVFCMGEDGYEQVLGFSVRGELLGFDAIGMGRYTNQAVALEESSVYVVQLRHFFSITPRDPALDRAVFRAVSTVLQQRGELADMMAAVSAEVRLARFLVHVSRRMSANGLSSRAFHLRMSRRDIASYLGVAHETVSRSFTALVNLQFVSVKNRAVDIIDMDGLRAFSASTRKQLDDANRLHGHRGATLCSQEASLIA